MKTITAAITLLLLPAVLSAEGKGILMGSVVKSDVWKMDRKNGREIFRGNVTFSNEEYKLRSDYAEYHRENKKWLLEGNVRCERKFPDSGLIRLFCDKSEFSGEFEKGTLYGIKKKVKSIYNTGKGKEIIAYCDRIDVDYPNNEILFLENFSMRDGANYALARKARYDMAKGIFLMSGARPVIRSLDEKYNFALRGKVIKYNHETGDIAVNGESEGWLDLKGGKPYDFKIGTFGKTIQ